MRFRSLFFLFLFIFSATLIAQKSGDYVSKTPVSGGFSLISKGKTPDLLVSETDFPGIFRVAEDLQNDMEKVSGTKPELLKEKKAAENLIIIGTLGKSELIDDLVQKGKINTDSLTGKWEKFTAQIVKNPMEGVKQALVIAGSDKRGTIYGMYDLSRQLGVSPWYFWADVPVEKESELYIKPGIYTCGEPKVKYRGIFLNDEMPALGGWADENYGGFTSGFYEHVFELILRLNGNYLWPAMWGRMFYVDDPKNAALADEYGIVMGTSHHEPLARAHAEWDRFGEGAWDFSKNADTLTKFWTEGMQRRGNTETLVTVGMRGDGDEPMTQGTAIDLLETIVSAQREIISEVTRKPAEETPQLWALYKEVQDYYDQGMRVPDDVTLLFSDDNWGNIRKLPELNAEPRKGGYGIYYHFDYVGGPRNYKWINTTQIERTWEQMHLAYEYGVDEVWIVNVGDLKPMEFPISFFLDYAWDPEAIDVSNLQQYYTDWAAKTFNDQKTEEIADILRKCTKYNSRRKPEMIDTTTYSLFHYNEAERVVQSYDSLAAKAKKVGEDLPSEYQDAYYELVLFPVLASANLNELYVAAAKNHLYASQGRAATNMYAEKVKELFKKDAELTNYYNTQLADGKWDHMMSQTHIGYTYWQQPEENTIPPTKTTELPEEASLGVALSGTEQWWPHAKGEAQLPIFYNFKDQKQTITVFNRGQKNLDFTLKSVQKWVILPEKQQKTALQKEIPVGIDWEQAPPGKSEGTIIISSGKEKVSIKVSIENKPVDTLEGFQEENGYIAIAAPRFSAKTTENGINWMIIDNLGKTGSAITSMPVSVSTKQITATSPRLEYTINLESANTVEVHAYFSPTLNYTSGDGLYYGIAIDDEQPQLINIHTDKSAPGWNKSVADNIKVLTTKHSISKPGKHTLKYFMVDGGVVLQKIVIDTGGLRKTYLGPPESKVVK
ncbi:glycosyl hydrolase 115 family protein [Flavimarina sp. Hel_I_48]|uniref:glycosyl hydrolase 115 family protein n=1 Tax=Flavimarina sp. Hel_I_48 TaxID=1392488 RepID=UPI0004DF51FA|nr:glycosyl hydrolase 115 family protein [Flavimarina sp. Hel_I_48]